MHTIKVARSWQSGEMRSECIKVHLPFLWKYIQGASNWLCKNGSFVCDGLDNVGLENRVAPGRGFNMEGTELGVWNIHDDGRKSKVVGCVYLGISVVPVAIISRIRRWMTFFWVMECKSVGKEFSLSDWFTLELLTGNFIAFRVSIKQWREKISLSSESYCLVLKSCWCIMKLKFTVLLHLIWYRTLNNCLWTFLNEFL